MVFAGEDDSVGPIQTIRKAYSEIYGLKNYYPVIVHPAHISKETAVYYSVNYPNYFDPYIPERKQTRLMDKLRSLQNAVQTILDKRLMEGSEYQFFHSSGNQYSGIDNADHILNYEHDLKNRLEIEGLEFPSNSPFFKGCVRISI